MQIPKFENSDWDLLLTKMQKGEVVPFLGHELLICRTEEPRDLYSIVAPKLAEELGVKYKAERDRPPLHVVSETYLRDRHAKIETIYAKIPGIVESMKFEIPDPLSKLARITDFNLYVSTTFDEFLQKAIDKERYNGKHKHDSLIYSTHSKRDDLPSAFNRNEPIVYHLFGRMEPAFTYAVTEDDILDFGHNLQLEDKRPKNLFDELGTKCLLMLGCSFPDWLARFIIRSIKGTNEGNIKPGFGYIADNKSLKSYELMQFLTRHQANVYQCCKGVTEFVDELYNRWITRKDKIKEYSTVAEHKDFSPGKIFISYAKENRIAADKIFAALKAKDLDPWMDASQLEPGDDFKKVILENIKTAALFIPVISETIFDPGERFYKLEWNTAIASLTRRLCNEDFIVPIIVDSLSPNDPKIPEQFNTRHCSTFNNGELPEEFANAIQTKIRKIKGTNRVMA
jgi:hypothetical protein